MFRAVILPFVLMAIVAGGLALQLERLSGTAATVERAERVIAQADEVLKRILDQETGVRAFLVTRDRSFLQPYVEARPDQALDDLERLSSDSPELAVTASVLHDRYRAWYARAAEAVVDPEAAGTTEAMLARKAEMDMVRALIDGIVTREDAVRRARGRAAEEETRFTAMGSIIVLAGLGGALSILSRRRLRQIVDTYEGALHRSAESEAALAQLVDREREAREKVQDALRAKDEFLSTLSHELRTPLTAILGWSGVLGSRTVPPETRSRALAAIERNARAQAQIVDDILDVSRVVAGKFQLRLAMTDVAAVVRAALDVVKFSAESKGVAIVTALGAESIPLIGDPDRLQQVVWNLLSNAVKFTPKRGRVEVHVRRVDSRVSIQVRDTGEGITPEFLPHVFERFRQADSSFKRAHGGLGLGLALVKHLVDLHGGEVRAESEGSGRGAVFTVTLPVLAASAVLEAPPGDVAAVNGATSLSGIRALVVDDDADSLAVLSAILREHGADVASATSGAAALAILERGPVDVIVSDLGMPELDGYELIQRIRAAEAPPPALALTAYAAVEDIERAHLAGFQRHLSKPVTPGHLVAAVAGLVRVE